MNLNITMSLYLKQIVQTQELQILHSTPKVQSQHRLQLNQPETNRILLVGVCENSTGCPKKTLQRFKIKFFLGHPV